MPQSTHASQPALQWVSTSTGSPGAFLAAMSSMILQPVLADAAAGLDVLVADLGCALVGRRDALIARQVLHGAAHLLQRPAQVDRGRALLGQEFDGAIDGLVGGVLPDRHGEAVGGGGADQRRAAHLHREDRARGLLARPQRDDDELVRQPRLVDDLDRPAVVREPDGASRPCR